MTSTDREAKFEPLAKATLDEVFRVYRAGTPSQRVWGWLHGDEPKTAVQESFPASGGAPWLILFTAQPEYSHIVASHLPIWMAKVVKRLVKQVTLKPGEHIFFGFDLTSVKGVELRGPTS